MSITNYPNGVSSFGVPLPGAFNNVYGTYYFVDATNGSDGNNGLSVGSAFATIQKAVTTQGLFSTGIGDQITIFPGTYAESIVGELANVSLVGVSADSVIIAPTDSHALLVGADGTITSTMTNSTLRNITFLTPSSSNTTYAAVTIAVMTKSAILNCKFKGTTITGFDASATVGLQIGNRTDTSWEFHEHSRISGNEFTSNAGRNTELGRAIIVGAQTTANPEQKGFKSMIIESNIISAFDTGILLNTGSSSNGGTVVGHNVITSQQGGIGVNRGIISGSTDGADALTMVVNNRVTAIADSIGNFSTNNVQGNIISENGAAPTSETGQ